MYFHDRKTGPSIRDPRLTQGEYVDIGYEEILTEVNSFNIISIIQYLNNNINVGKTSTD